MPLDRLVEIAVTAISASKSRTCPCAATRVDGLWVLQDAVVRRYPRKVEVFACDGDPHRVVESVRSAGLGWHFLCDVTSVEQDPKPRRHAYKALGYRAIATEWAYAHTLDAIPVFESDPPVRIVRTPAEFAGIPRGDWRRRHWDPGVTLFAIWTETEALGWVHTRRVGAEAWVGDLYVPEGHRRLGYGRALMSALLRHDRGQGVRASVLLASSAGAQLYPQLGYELVGTLQLFCPRDRNYPSS